MTARNKTREVLAIIFVVFLCLSVNKATAQANVLGPQPGTAPLKGFVDLHTHPLSNLGFAGKLLYGGVDIGSLLPADPNCNHNVRATSMQQALGNCNSTHGGVNLLNNQCGDYLRNQVIKQTQNGPPQAASCGDGNGAPNFDSWPAWNDITHQSMWVDWIRRSYLGGLRVMVALAVNNKTLADMVAGPGDGPDDDKTSADLQLRELKMFVNRHSDFMEIALSAADLERIVRANKLAVIPGMEIDHIGNFGTPGSVAENQLTDVEIVKEIDRLFGEGVRYIFPVHLLDNPFGGTATYQDLMNYSNFRESGHWWDFNNIPGFTYRFGSQNGFLFNAAILAKLGLATTSTYQEFSPPNYQKPNPGFGEANKRGLTIQGKIAIREMMRLGMLIDIDHMSDLAKNQTIDIAKEIPGGYPLNSGHSGLRVNGSTSVNERSTSLAQYQEIFKLHGMAGIGSAGIDAYQWTRSYRMVAQVMGPGAAAGFGTDANGISPLMPPRGCFNFGDISKQKFWTGDFTGAGHADIMFYHQQDGNWWLGTFQAGKITWILAGNTNGFGDISKLQFWTGDFIGNGHIQIMFYSPHDGNWWLGAFHGTTLSWELAGNTTGFGNIAAQHFWTGDFTTPGRAQIMFYSPADGNWWLGSFQVEGDKLIWALAGNTKGFGNIAGQPFWTGDFTGSGHAGIMFYHQQDNSWWLGTFQGANLTWALAGNTKSLGDISKQPFWTGDFTGSGHAGIMFYHQQDGNWWLGTFQGATLTWALAGNTNGFGDISKQPFWTGNFTGSGHVEIMFYHQQDGNWWLGTFQGPKLTWALAGNTNGFGDISRQPFWTGRFGEPVHDEIMFYHQQDGNWWLESPQGAKFTWALAGNTAGLGNYANVKYDNSFPMCSLGNKSWDYNQYGVAHYGLLPDFLQDVKTDIPDDGAAVYTNLMTGAEYFLQTWKKCETEKANVH